MAIFFGWITFSIIVAAIGAERKIGGIASFFISLILSPIIGLIVTLVSDKKTDVQFKEQLLEQTKRDNSIGTAKEIEDLYALYQKGILTESEFNHKKAQILNR